ncbi:MAG: hypothetical protein J6J66_07125, partial [Clostridia bacterium]|nr:hypothetical protein [Clostridia bacterium]
MPPWQKSLQPKRQSFTPDGSTETVTVDQTITPKEFTTEGEAKLFYGAGNTLFKATGDNWTFTVDGAALTDLTVTDAMVGKTIVAGGVDKVYYTSEEIGADNSSKMIYHLVSDVEKYFSTSNTGDRGDGTNTGASSYQDLRPYPTGTEGRNTIKSVAVVLYEDVDVASFTMNWFIDEASRNGGRVAYFDLNGHNVVNRTTGNYMEIKTIAMCLYSSKPGAHWYQPNSNAIFYVSDDATLCLGNNASDGAYADNLSVHGKTLFHMMYGNGSMIWGGHYYQTGGTSYMVRMSRRFPVAKNASFYVLDGNAVFGDPDDHETALATVSNCKFYSNGASDLLTGSKSAAISFAGCDFYGINTELDETVVKATLDAACTKNKAVTYNTVTWADGTSSYYYATSEAEAKAFVETHPKAAPAPYGKWVDGEYFVALNPSYTYAYDDAFNAEQTLVDGELTKVYYTLTIGDKVTYVTDGSTLNNYLRSMDYG